MLNRAKIFVLCAAAILTGCASGAVDLKIHQINSLASVNENDGGFRGLEFLADPIPGQTGNRVNIFYLHGIGWTENPEADQLGNDFLAGIAKAYGLEVEGQIVNSPCGAEDSEDVEHSSNHIFVTPGEEPVYFETAIPGVRLKMDELVCIDKQTLQVDPSLEYVVYRIFWDDIFWNRLQVAHVGQDDGYDDESIIAALRRKYNRRLKDEIVNYGISDAVMYLGPAGEQIRNAVRGAMCSAALDAAGYSFADQGHDISYKTACNAATRTSIKTNQFAFVTESLGSKITFDVMREAMTDGRDTILDDMIAGSETYMLANQIALLSLSELTMAPRTKPYVLKSEPRPRIVALSEINDILTYEINPFYEQLWSRRDGSERGAQFDARSRQLLIENIGFDFVDVRLEFADKVISVFDGFVDPMQAHLGHASEPEIMIYLLCGAKNGQINDQNCLATTPLP